MHMQMKQGTREQSTRKHVYFNLDLNTPPSRHFNPLTNNHSAF
jgi:hypothetical protein